MRNRICALLFFVCLCFGRSAPAQTAYAPGGLFVNPTAYTFKRNTISMYSAAFDQYPEDGRQQEFVPFSLTYCPTDRLQVSGLLIFHDGWFERRHMHGGAFGKYQLVSDTPSHPAFAITGAYVANDHLQSTVAGVVSHAFTRHGAPILIAHTGVKWGQAFGGGHPSDYAGFVGLEVPVGREFRLVAEDSTRFSFDQAPASGIGVMWQPRRGPGLTVGFVGTGRSKQLGFFFGVGISLGGLK